MARQRKFCVMAKRKSGSALPSVTIKASVMLFGLPRLMIGMPQFRATPHGAVYAAGFAQVETVPQPANCVSHRLLVIPSLGVWLRPTHTSQPSSFSWNELVGVPQSVLNGAGRSRQLRRK